MWDRMVVEKMEGCVGDFAAVSFKNTENGFLWAFVGVYGPNSDNTRKHLWDELAALCSL